MTPSFPAIRPQSDRINRNLKPSRPPMFLQRPSATSSNRQAVTPPSGGAVSLDASVARMPIMPIYDVAQVCYGRSPPTRDPAFTCKYMRHVATVATSSLFVPLPLGNLGRVKSCSALDVRCAGRRCSCPRDPSASLIRFPFPRPPATKNAGGRRHAPIGEPTVLGERPVVAPSRFAP